ncbi:MAG: hypothetical protein B6245_02805 [Desulfobacteraceae bacterium 4572_88]|nr:MAG: hypothetical protein B6245_02805 [Desulfobacteraceae bacterium 4572_88]
MRSQAEPGNELMKKIFTRYQALPGNAGCKALPCDINICSTLLKKIFARYEALPGNADCKARPLSYLPKQFRSIPKP